MVGLMIGLLIAVSYHAKDLCDYGTLVDKAPKTLLEPQPEWFIDEEHYNKALELFNTNGTWATLEDGTDCTI